MADTDTMQLPTIVTRPRLRRWQYPRQPALLVFVVALLAGAFQMWRPSLWGDEAATWSAIARPVPALLELATHKDAALTPYYLMMKAWSAVGGTSEAWLRLPSVVAAAAAAALTAALGRRLYSARAGLCAGVVLAITPAFVRYAQEARPYALAMLLAVVASWLFVRAVEYQHPRRWALYGVALLAIGLTHLIALLVVVAHAVGLRGKPVRRQLLAMPGAALLLLIPFAMYVRPQQTAEWRVPAWRSLPQLLSPLTASSALGLAVTGILLVGLRRRHATPLIVAWAALPVFLAAGAHIVPLYTPRYVIFCLPAIALLVGAVIAELTPRRVAVTLLVLAVLASHAWMAVRTPGAHSQDYRAAVAAMGTDPQDAVVFEPAYQRPGVYYYWRNQPRHPADPTLAAPLLEHPRWFGGFERPDILGQLRPYQRVWLVRFNAQASASAKAQTLGRQFRPVRDVHVSGLTVTLYERCAGERLGADSPTCS